MKGYKYILGIDLGTTNTLASFLKGGKTELVKFPGGRMLPSILYVDENGEVFVGKKARNRGALDPSNMIRSSKTYIGDYECNKTWVCHGRTFTPTDVATEVLKEVRRCFVKQLHISEEDKIAAVITVPAYFNSNQTDETRKAGEAAGFKVLQIITEPMAAAVAAVKSMDLNKKVLVVDLGGGTFDLSVLEANQANHSYRALAIDGDSRLGGDDFDNALSGYLVHLVENDTGRTLSSLKSSAMNESDYYSLLNRINIAAEQAKIDLSQELETDIAIPELFDGYGLDISLSRDEFDEICQSLYDRVLNRVREFVNKNNKFTKKDLSEVILAGGSCYIPFIQKAIYDEFQCAPQGEIDRSTLVVYGACLVANAEQSIVIEDILSHSLGIEVIEAGKKILSKILSKDTPYPCMRTERYTTVEDNQREILVKIYEASSDCENIKAIEKHKLYGQMLLQGIEIAPKGEPKVDVTFQYDKSRCLTVTAKDAKTGATQSIQLKKGASA